MCDHTETLVFSEDALRDVEAIMRRYPTKQAATLPLLHLAQREFGWLSNPVIEYMAGFIGINPIELKNTVSFYSMFFQKEVGRHVIWICHTLPCALGGAAELLTHLKQRLQIGVGETTPDRMFTLLKAECLGSCGTAPVIQINDTYYENLTVEKLDAILDGLSKNDE